MNALDSLQGVRANRGYFIPFSMSRASSHMCSQEGEKRVRGGADRGTFREKECFKGNVLNRIAPVPLLHKKK